ncbi:hypothetical protein CPB84DRAFT_1745765 [Gymnopilus junonius]|uniref:Uncharacterized protein n=1 Tax=Gymnopilus junonius TaxID=109634 RepID=A0A9P5TQ68_GYMJU|nr:hypothetical protein CPB84DRAFT_1745765 [Gymnopilus junonius]
MASDLEFTPQNGAKSVYARRLHGSERMTAAIAEHADGFGHIYVGIHVTFKEDISQTALVAAVKEAWMQTRFLTPWMATRTSKIENAEANSWSLTYDACLKPAWAEETVMWRNEVLSLVEWEEKIEDAYWKPSAGRFGVEVTLARAPSTGYHFLLSIAHWLADGRGILPIIDLLFVNLKAVLCGRAQPSNSLPWGKEIERLSPAVISAIETSPNVANPPPPPAAPEGTSAPTQFLRPLIESTQWEGLPSKQAEIMLSQAETSAFHAVCKKHGTHVTAVLNSIHIIADVETALRVAANTSSKSSEVYEAFHKSDVYPVFTNVADRRPYLSSRWPSVNAAGGFGSVVNDNFVTFHSMDLVRRCIRFDKDGSPLPSFSKPDFWEGIASETQALMKQNMKTTSDIFFLTQNGIDAVVPQFDPSAVAIPGIMCSSVGHLASLKLFNDFLPAVAGPDPGTPFVLEDMSFAVRATGVTAVVAMMWEYNGRLAIHLQGSPRWHSPEAWKMFGDSVKRAIKEIISEHEGSRVEARL